jgi:cell division GTPase FtsZ
MIDVSLEVKTLKGIKAIAERVIQPDSIVKLDEADLKAMMGESDTALVVTGTGPAGSSLSALFEKARKGLLSAGISFDTKSVIFQIVAGEEMDILEIDNGMTTFLPVLDEDVNIAWGHCEPQSDGKVSVTFAASVKNTAGKAIQS